MGDLIGLIYNSDISVWLRSTTWVIRSVQTVHLLALASLVASAIFLDLKLAGVLARTEANMVVYHRYMPTLWVALAVLLVSGSTLLWAEPDRVLANWVFWTKMSLVLVAFLFTLTMRRIMLRNDDARQERHLPAPLSALLGWVALIVWVIALGCGRWIAYTY